MPNTCCVTNCNGNYNAENKVCIFSFPKDEELLQKWIKAIPRENFVVTKNTKVSYFILINFKIFYSYCFLN